MLKGSMTIPVGIALGSNLGNRRAELDAAVRFLAGLAADGRVKESQRIETVPVDCPPGSPLFLNAVAEIEVDPASWPPLKLLKMLRDLEFKQDREAAGVLHAPRTLDLDLIYYGTQTIHEPGLVVPHPRAHLRRFVLEPLSQIRPDLILPGQAKTVRELLAGLG